MIFQAVRYFRHKVVFQAVRYFRHQVFQAVKYFRHQGFSGSMVFQALDGVDISVKYIRQTFI